MYQPIKLTHVPSKELDRRRNRLLNQFYIDPVTESVSTYEDIDLLKEIYLEAVFRDGRRSLDPIVDQFEKIKKLLDSQIKIQELSNETDKTTFFNPKTFWKDSLFKEMENKLQKLFGFRNVEIHSYAEKYDSKEKKFESKILNCEISHLVRYPIDGIVTDKGFYDGTHSMNIKIMFSLGLIKTLTPEELTGVLLHEFGHSIDPAVVDINYMKTNILSKYLTDREKELTEAEKKFSENVVRKKFGSVFTPILISIGAAAIGIGIAAIISAILIFISNIAYRISEKNREKKYNGQIDVKIKKIQTLIQNDREFSKRSNAEAFADNFARMYGFGGPLVSALNKMDKDTDNSIRTRIQKEQDRQNAILYLTESALKGNHKTNIHRIRSLLREYQNDLNNPDISSKVKKDIKTDMDELQRVLDSYMNSFSEFQNQINKIIIEELDKNDNKEPMISDEKKAELIKEGFEFFDEIYTESIELYEEKKKIKHPLQQRMEEECPLERGDMAKINKRFGPSRSCSFAKDKKGYFAYTHRCRSKSYPSIEELPIKDVEFVRSTS